MTFRRRLTSQPYSILRDCAATLVFILTLASASPAHADMIFNVNTMADQVDQDVSDGLCQTSDGACSLRAAIMQANHTAGLETTHVVLPAGEYVLTQTPTESDGEENGDLNLTTPVLAGQILSIEGDSAESTVIDANGIDRVLFIRPDRTAVISRVTIRHGLVNSAGGGIRLDGTLTLIDSIVTENSGSAGGGGIWININGRLVALGSKFTANTAQNGGGGLYVNGRATIRESSVTDNSSSFGAGVVVAGPGISVLNIYNSTISGNAASTMGGGVYNNSATGYFVNTTISGNLANGNGGGIWNSGQTWLYNTSIIANDASHDRNPPGGVGGGTFNFNGAASRLVAINSLIADNTTLDAPIADDCNGTLEVYGWNLLADYTGCSFSGNGTAARGLVSPATIGPLADNGGPTWTHALLPGSEAIDTTTAQGCIDPTGALLATEQRGAVRIAGPKCDVGAYEFGAEDIVFRNGFD